MPGIAIHSHECTLSAPTVRGVIDHLGLSDSVSVFSLMIAGQNKICQRGINK